MPAEPYDRNLQRLTPTRASGIGGASGCPHCVRATSETRSIAHVRGGLPGYLLRRVVDYIDAEPSGDLTLGRLAYLAGMSPHHFACLFRRSTGIPPHQFVLLRRIDLARERLCEERCSILDIALDCGFGNPSHFARTFRKFAGVSPSAFRVLMRSSRRFAEDAGPEGVPSPARSRAMAHSDGTVVRYSA
jgi:AraC-like DNA-binding protein